MANKIITKKELSIKYGVSYNTFMKWLKNIPELNISKDRRLLTPKQIETIYEMLGQPS
jgi:abortive infection bacteriophage resistance protein